MTYQDLAYLHLATVLPAFILGTFLIFNRKGTDTHKLIGKIFLCLMLSTAVITLFMKAEIGPKIFDHFGFIHLFSFNVIYGVPVAYFAARNGNIKVHKANMIGMYVFGLLVAGSFALMPGRLLHKWLFE
jgi:uncharacterized membrane protein